MQESHALILPREIKLTPHKNLHVDVYSSFSHNCQNMEATKKSFSYLRNKRWYIQTMECYSELKKWAITSQKDLEELSAYYKWKKPVWQGSIL